uniref:Retrovirus-related Pol polyprotein from transposon opus n=1 Tax=Lygus hesperus TaxID=30085 RepID=A0A0A9XAZ6_LYGHE
MLGFTPPTLTPWEAKPSQIYYDLRECLADTNLDPNNGEENNGKQWKGLATDPRKELEEKTSHLTKAERERMSQVLQKYPDIFEKPHKDGCLLGVTHQIDTGEAGLIHVRSYPIPHALRPEIEEQVKDMLEDGIIQPSKSLWCAPAVLVKKQERPRNGGFALTIVAWTRSQKQTPILPPISRTHWLCLVNANISASWT